MTSPSAQKNPHRKIPFFNSLQTKYALSYLVLFAVVLILLNTYPILASQDLLFGSKRDAMKSQAAVISSALMELESLSAEQVEKVMNMLDSTGLSRVMVTDPSGMILYDSLSTNQQPTPSQTTPTFRYALIREIVQALNGQDVFYSQYRNNLFASCAAMPIVYRGMTIGAIYICEEDAAQGALLLSLQKNLRSNFPGHRRRYTTGQYSLFPPADHPHQCPASGHPDCRGRRVRSPSAAGGQG
jgi:hypothetical protein